MRLGKLSKDRGRRRAKTGSIQAARSLVWWIVPRPLCPYPQVAVYKGSGSTDDAAKFWLFGDIIAADQVSAMRVAPFIAVVGISLFLAPLS